MAELLFTVRERQDRAPLAGVTVHVAPMLIFRWRTGLDLPALGREVATTVSSDGISSARPGTDAGEGRADEPGHHETSFGLPAVQATSDSAGEVAFTWDPASQAIDSLVQAHNKPLYSRLPTILMAFRVDVSLPGVTPVAGAVALGQMLSRRVDLDGVLVEGIALDLASTIVGHCAAAPRSGSTPAHASARLWFAMWKDVLGSVRLVMTPALLSSRTSMVQPGPKPTSLPVTFSAGPVRTAVVDVAGLAPTTTYHYRLEVTLPALPGTPNQVWTVARGSFHTPDPSAADHRLAFASCQPANPDRHRPSMWQRLDAWNPDDILLLGDQVYGDYTDPTFARRLYDALLSGSPKPTPHLPGGGWRAFYDRRYYQAWASPIVREVMRRRPIYMMLDDHDVADDWGTKFTLADRPDQVGAALESYETFQHAHNPDRSPPRQSGDTYDFAIDRGWLQAYVLDARSGRQPNLHPNAAPVLGTAQRTRLASWAAAPATRAADVIVLASPTPLALLDAARLADLIRAIGPAVELGSDVSHALSNLTESVFGWGTPTFESPFEIDDGEVTEPDLADQWNDPDNLADLRFVLDALFELQNDVSGGGAHRRAVIVVSGDAHVGAIHRIVSSDQAHADNPVIYQITASPIGRQNKMDWIAKLLGYANDVPQPIPLGGPYGARMMGAFGRINYGTLATGRIPGPGRRYEVRAALHFEPMRSVIGSSGDEARLDLFFDLDHPGRPRDIWQPPEVRLGRG